MEVEAATPAMAVTDIRGNGVTAPPQGSKISHKRG